MQPFSISPNKLNRDILTEQEGHDDPVSLHWLIRKIPTYQTLQYLGIGLKQDPYEGLKLITVVHMFSKKKISKDFII